MPDGRVPFGVTAANTAAMTAEDGCHGWTALKIGPARRPAPPEPSTHHAQDPSVHAEKGNLNRPEFGGDFLSWKDDLHAEAVPEGAP